MSRAYRFKASQAFLTYAQCPLEREYVLDSITDKLAELDRTTMVTIDAHCVAQELHEDGNFHIHAYFKFSSKLSFENPDFFDIKVGEVHYHPNITAPRSSVAVIKYVQKDKNFISSDNIVDILNKRSYGTIRKDATSRTEYLEMIGTHFPRDLALNYDRLDQYSRILFPETKVTYENPYTTFGNVPEALTKWCDNLTRPNPNPMTGKCINPNTLTLMLSHLGLIQP